MFLYRLDAIALCAAIVLFVIQIYRTATMGRQLAVSRRAGAGYDADLLQQHRQALIRILVFAFVALTCIEILVHEMPDVRASPQPLFAFHLCVVASLLTLYAAIWMRYTGLFNPKIHRVLNYVGLVLLITVVVSGTISLLLRLPLHEILVF